MTEEAQWFDIKAEQQTFLTTCPKKKKRIQMNSLIYELKNKTSIEWYTRPPYIQKQQQKGQK